MPVVSISVQLLNTLLGQTFPQERLVGALEQLGCDVEDSVDLTLYRCPRCETLNDRPAGEEAVTRCLYCGWEQADGFPRFGSDSAIRIDLLANRPDLFNVTGLARALRGYLEIESGMPRFSVRPGQVEVKVDPQVHDIRPYIVAAVVELPPLDHTTLRELMKLQENLHWGVGRDRKLASIGIYDLQAITPPITYSAVAPQELRFHPLGMADSLLTPAEILRDHPKGAAYAHLLEKLPRYPLLRDAKGQVLSMPPIINSEETKCRIGSQRLFIDVTGLSEAAVTDSLNILVCAVAELGGTIESVTVNHPDRALACPDLQPRTMEVGRAAAERWLGIPIPVEEFRRSIGKMRLDVEPLAAPTGKTDHRVTYPAFRSDLRHEVDIFEDVLIGYGLERIPHLLVPTMTVGSERPEEQRAVLLRSTMTGLGFTEIMSLNLNSEENLFNAFRSTAEAAGAVVVGNPKTALQRALRPHLMTGLMETLEKNRRKPVPQRLFEIGPVTVLDAQAETGVAEFRHLAFVVIGPAAGYAEGRAVLDALLHELGLSGTFRAADNPAFLPGRCAEIDIADGPCRARLGELHPAVLNHFNLAYPVVLGELRFFQICGSAQTGF